MLPGVPGEDPDDASGHDRCGDAKDADEWRDLSDFADDLGLHLLRVS